MVNVVRINKKTLESIELQDNKRVVPGRWGKFPEDESFTVLEFMELEYLTNNDILWVVLREPFLTYNQLLLAGQKFASSSIGKVEEYFGEKNAVVIDGLMAKKHYIEKKMTMDENISCWKNVQALIDHMRAKKKPGQGDALNAIRSVCWNAIGVFKWTHTKVEDWRVTPWPNLGWQIRDVAWAARRAFGDTPECEQAQLATIKEILESK